MSHDLINFAKEYSRAFKSETDRLKLTISKKSTSVPFNVHTKQISDELRQDGIFIKAAATGIDIGVDTTAANKRSTAHQNARVKKA